MGAKLCVKKARLLLRKIIPRKNHITQIMWANEVIHMWTVDIATGADELLDNCWSKKKRKFSSKKVEPHLFLSKHLSPINQSFAGNPFLIAKWVQR